MSANLSAEQTKLQQLFAAIWDDYLELNPDARSIYQLFGGAAEVVNDHIALRTFNIEKVNIVCSLLHSRVCGIVNQLQSEVDWSNVIQEFTHPPSSTSNLDKSLHS